MGLFRNIKKEENKYNPKLLQAIINFIADSLLFKLVIEIFLSTGMTIEQTPLNIPQKQIEETNPKTPIHYGKIFQFIAETLVFQPITLIRLDMEKDTIQKIKEIHNYTENLLDKLEEGKIKDYIG